MSAHVRHEDGVISRATPCPTCGDYATGTKVFDGNGGGVLTTTRCECGWQHYFPDMDGRAE